MLLLEALLYAKQYLAFATLGMHPVERAGPTVDPCTGCPEKDMGAEECDGSGRCLTQVYTPPTAGVLDGGAFSSFLQTNQANTKIAGGALHLI